MSAKPSFSVGRALAAAAGSLPAAWGGAWLVLILVWALLAFGPGLLLVAVGKSYFPVLPPLFGVVTVVCELMLLGALYRAILFGKMARAEGLGFGGLQLGMPEWRLFLADLIVDGFILLILAALVIVFAVAFTTAGKGHDYPNTFVAIGALFSRHQGSDWVFILYLAGSAVFALFLVLKFLLRHAATVAERRIVALNALGLSSGNVGKLFLGLIVILVPFYAVVGGVMYLAGSYGFVGWVPTHGHLFGGGIWQRAVIQALDFGVALPLMTGFLSSAYRQIVDLRAK